MKGLRTIITISEQDKRWLATYSELHGISQAEAVRKGISCLKAAEGRSDFQMLVRNTAGLWKRGDGLSYQEKLRSEWEES